MKNALISTKVLILSIVTTITILVGLVMSYSVLQNLSDNNEQMERELFSRTAEINSMLSLFGYGHTTHNFKNLVLRGTEKYATRVEQDAGPFRKSVQRMQDEAALWRAADELLAFLEGTGRQNILIEIANEIDVVLDRTGYDLFTPDRQAEMIVARGVDDSTPVQRIEAADAAAAAAEAEKRRTAPLEGQTPLLPEGQSVRDHLAEFIDWTPIYISTGYGKPAIRSLPMSIFVNGSNVTYRLVASHSRRANPTFT